MNVKELKVEMIRHNENGDDLANGLGISRQTLSRKMNNKAEFTQKEISAIKERYNLMPERVSEIFFADKVSV